jgi:hypothetical protein
LQNSSSAAGQNSTRGRCRGRCLRPSLQGDLAQSARCATACHVANGSVMLTMFISDFVVALVRFGVALLKS